MEHDFWLEKWRVGDLGWHSADPCPDLLLHWNEIGVDSPGSVLVPLCGKSVDMIWLRDQGFSVVGVELSELAIAQFFEESGEAFVKTRQGIFEIFQGNGISIFQGDFFRLTREHLLDVGYVYDRAALIALPAEMRRRYVLKLEEILSAGWRQLLVTIDYPKELSLCPPFRVKEEEISTQLYPSSKVRLLGERLVKSARGEFVWSSYAIVS
jgi:thiopurine S-methyltransferase